MRCESKTLIADNKRIAPGYFLMRLQSSPIARNALPGQFLHIKCGNNSLLRRPLSIHRVIDNKTVEVLYKVVGKGTDYLSRRKKGEKIDCLGPLGNGFQLIKSEILHPPCFLWKTKKGGEHPKSEILLVAGGIGIAPLFFLAEKLRKSKIQNPHCSDVTSEQNMGTGPKSEIAAFLGAKTRNDILCVEKLKKLGVKIHISTDDGSLGYKGLVSALLKNNLSSVFCHPRLPNPGGQVSSVIYACGPKRMLKAVAIISKEHKIPCQVSFEQFMGCGIGICNACVIKTKQGYKRVCKDGPVFDAKEIDWGKI